VENKPNLWLKSGGKKKGTEGKMKTPNFATQSLEGEEAVDTKNYSLSRQKDNLSQAATGKRTPIKKAGRGELGDVSLL